MLYDTAGGVSATYNFADNDVDLVMHAHNQINDGVVCNIRQRVILTSTDQDYDFPKDMTAQDKCTVILQAENNYGPGFKITAQGYNDYQLAFVEFNADGLANSSKWGTTDESKLYIGNYSTGGPFLNFVKTTDVGSAAPKLEKYWNTYYQAGNT